MSFETTAPDGVIRYMGQITSAINLIKHHEGCTLKSKPDAKGKWSIGWGKDIPPPGQEGHIAECTPEEADAWLVNNSIDATKSARMVIGPAMWGDLSEPRQGVLTDMAYEMGQAGLGAFKDMILAIHDGDWPRAAKAGLDSVWDTQVPNRAKEDMEILETDRWPGENSSVEKAIPAIVSITKIPDYLEPKENALMAQTSQSLSTSSVSIGTTTNLAVGSASSLAVVKWLIASATVGHFIMPDDTLLTFMCVSVMPFGHLIYLGFASWFSKKTGVTLPDQ